MNPGLKRLPARFYRTDAGREPVREWLKGLDLPDRNVIGEDVKDVEFSWPIGMPLVGSLGNDLWEVRSSLARGRIARVIFCVEHGSMVLLHGFMKKRRRLRKGILTWRSGERRDHTHEKAKHRIVPR
jgi:phage-related protein